MTRKNIHSLEKNSQNQNQTLRRQTNNNHISNKIGIIIIPLFASIFEWNDTDIKIVVDIFDFICTYGIPVSLLL